MHEFFKIASRRVWVCFLLFAFQSIGSASTMTVSIGPRSWAHEYAELPVYIYLDGEIDASAPKRLSQALTKVPDRPGGIHIVLNSRGGNLIAGMDLGRIIRKSGATTTVGVSDLSQPELLPVKGECFSACSLAFLGGPYRYFIEGSSYGVHRVSRATGPESMDLDVGQILSADIGSYIREMGVDPGLFDLMVKAGASEIYLLSEQEAKALNVVNNGRMPSEWSIEATPEGTYLKGVQNTEHGEGKFTFGCLDEKIFIFSFYQAGDRAKVIADGSWIHSLMIDNDLISLPAPSGIQSKGDSLETMFSLNKSQFPFQRAMSAKSIGHAMMHSRKDAFYVGYNVEIDSKSAQLVRNFIGNCGQIK